MTTMTGITPTAAAHVLWHYGEGGYKPGAFIASLIAAIAKADRPNRARLALGFPEYVAACELADRTPGGLETLNNIAAEL